MQPPPPEDQPPPTTCLAVVQAWRTQIIHHPHQERTLRERLGLTAATAKKNSNNKRTQEPDDKTQHSPPPPKQIRLPSIGLLNQATARCPTENFESYVEKVMSQDENKNSILIPK